MNPWVGWGLAFVAVAAGWFSYGWQGVVLVVSVVAFWLLIQFNRSVRVMRDAAGSPVGQVPSAVMLQSRLRPGLPMLQIVKLTRSLGRHLSDTPETWAWHDAAGVEVQVVFERGRCARWVLNRPPEGA